MYVSWHKQTFPLRISAEERRTTWHMLSISTVSDYHFLKSTFCSRKTCEREKCYKSTQKKKHVLRNPNSFAFCNILCKRANKVSSDGAMCSVKRLLSWDDTQLSLREAKSGSFFSRWVCRTWLFNQRGTRDYGLLVQILISIICSRNINPWLLINCVVWHLKLVTVCLKRHVNILGGGKQCYWNSKIHKEKLDLLGAPDTQQQDSGCFHFNMAVSPVCHCCPSSFPSSSSACVAAGRALRGAQPWTKLLTASFSTAGTVGFILDRGFLQASRLSPP